MYKLAHFKDWQSILAFYQYIFSLCSIQVISGTPAGHVCLHWTTACVFGNLAYVIPLTSAWPYSGNTPAWDKYILSCDLGYSTYWIVNDCKAISFFKCTHPILNFLMTFILKNLQTRIEKQPFTTYYPRIVSNSTSNRPRAGTFFNQFSLQRTSYNILSVSTTQVPRTRSTTIKIVHTLFRFLCSYGIFVFQLIARLPAILKRVGITSTPRQHHYGLGVWAVINVSYFYKTNCSVLKSIFKGGLIKCIYVYVFLKGSSFQSF